jgi:hypothetical protein
VVAINEPSKHTSLLQGHLDQMSPSGGFVQDQMSLTQASTAIVGNTSPPTYWGSCASFSDIFQDAVIHKLAEDDQTDDLRDSRSRWELPQRHSCRKGGPEAPGELRRAARSQSHWTWGYKRLQMDWADVGDGWVAGRLS